jgi:hypothetical protein
MQPEPVQRSRTETGLLFEGEMALATRRVQSSVSGRGMSVGGRVKRLSGPNGVVPETGMEN